MALYGIFSFLDYAVYSVVAFVVRLIVLIANANFFGEDSINKVASKVYIILGVLVLFKIVVSCIQYMVNPDTFDDKDKGMGGILKKAAISMALLSLIPSIFNFALQMQTVIVSTIPGLVLSNTSGGSISFKKDSEDSIRTQLDEIGDKVAGSTIWTFVNVRKEYKSKKNMDNIPKTLENFRKEIQSNCNTGLDGIIHTDKCYFDYKILISTAAGLFLLYILCSMALDVGIRTIKLGIIQMLAPIPVSSYIVSTDKFNKFVKLSVKVYLDLFVRLGVIYFIIFFIREVIDGIDKSGDIIAGGAYQPDSLEKAFIKVIIIIALFMFAKNAPKFICDVLGIDSGGFGDLGDMFKPAWQRAGGAAAALYNPLRTAGSSALTSWQQSKNIRGNKSWWKTAKRIGRAVGAGARGATQGTFDSLQGMAAGDDWSKMSQRMKNRDTRAFKKAYEANYYRTLSRKDAAKQKIKNAVAGFMSYHGQTPINSSGYKEAASAISSLRSESFTGRAKGEVDKAPAMFSNMHTATTGGRLNGGDLIIQRSKRDASGRVVDDSGVIRTTFSVTDTAGIKYNNCDYAKLHELWKKIDNGTATDSDYVDFGTIQVTDANGVTSTRTFTKADASIISDIHERVGKKAYSEYVDIAVSAQARLDESAKLKDGDSRKLSKSQVDYLTGLADREVLDRIARFRETIVGLNIPDSEKGAMLTSLEKDAGGWLAGSNKKAQEFSTIATQMAKMEQASSGKNDK